jgi:hypothetical protein
MSLKLQKSGSSSNSENYLRKSAAEEREFWMKESALEMDELNGGGSEDKLNKKWTQLVTTISDIGVRGQCYNFEEC